MSTDIEDHVRHLLANADVPITEFKPQAIVSLGHRIRRTRLARRTAAGTLLAVVAACGTAALTVPASGNPLSTVVWAMGEGSAGTESGAFMTANNHRYLMSIRESRAGKNPTLVITRIEPDGSTHDMIGVGPVNPSEMPMFEMAVSSEHGVSFALFPAGSHNISPLPPTGAAPVTVSTMRIASPFDGPEYVAVSIGTTTDDTVTGYTWDDATGQPQSTRTR